MISSPHLTSMPCLNARMNSGLRSANHIFCLRSFLRTRRASAVIGRPNVLMYAS